ncbi:hypothetical protein ABTX62_05420 [Streptomyces sp. NPDC096046]|uniref:hypothetical protein n=1 Tax=Streptomyces sp. NPDC096046 TaxID=3155542 RepID=UPI00332F5540
MLTCRAGRSDAARDFARHLDLAGLALRVAAPLLVVDGDQDVIPGVTNGESLTATGAGRRIPVRPAR